MSPTNLINELEVENKQLKAQNRKLKRAVKIALSKLSFFERNYTNIGSWSFIDGLRKRMAEIRKLSKALRKMR